MMGMKRMEIEGQTIAVPFVKWVGGKRQLLAELASYYPKKFNRYFEPFIGGGANLLNLLPKKATISDHNLLTSYFII